MNYWTGTVALICLCIGVILLFASLSWFVNRRQDRLPMAYLLALVCLVVLQSLEFMYQASDWMERFPFFLKLVDPLIVMIPFCIYGYIRAIQGNHVLSQPGQWWLHAAPMILVAGLAIPFWSMSGEMKVYWMFQGREAESLWQPITLYGNSYLAVIAASSFFYWWLQQRKGINTRKPAVREWVKHLQRIQLIIVASMATRIAVYHLFGDSFSLAFVMAPTTAYLTFLLLTHAHPPMHVQRAAAIQADMKTPGEQKGPMPVDEIDTALFKALGSAMENGLFRENSLTLRSLAETCQTSTHQASAVINLCTGSNFYDWVNGYRIKAACEELSNTSRSVSDICYNVGFNSKSTFHTAFRKQIGCTPTEYRKKTSGESSSPP